jgi:CheY-like chemotaxis protein
MDEPVLFVDDEPNLLEAIARSLRSRFRIHTATSGEEGLRLLECSGPFTVVVSDMRMPGMSGAQFLSRARDLCPDTVRIILSGQSDLADTIAAVNDGNIFRFLSKPCTTQRLLAAVSMGVEQHQLITAEKVLLEQTLSGAVGLLVEMLSMVTPAAYARARRVQHYVVALAAALQLPQRWEWPLAALVSQIGCVSLPKDTLSKIEAEQPLTEEEQILYRSHPQLAARLLQSVPRLEDVAAMVASQNMSPGEICAEDARQWGVRSAGILMLRSAGEFDRHVLKGLSSRSAAEAVRAWDATLPRTLIEAMTLLPVAARGQIMKSLHLVDLAAGMFLDEALVTCKGACLVPAGQEVTPNLLTRLKSIACGVPLNEPFRVRVPI